MKFANEAMACVLKLEWWTDWMFLWSLTGRQRWTDAGLQVWRLVRKKLSDIWKGGCKTSLRFYSQVKCGAENSCGFFSLHHLFHCEGVFLPWFSLVSKYSHFSPSFLRFMSVFINAWFFCHLWQACPHKESYYRLCLISSTLWPGILIPAPTGGGCSSMCWDHALLIAFQAGSLGSYMSPARGTTHAPWSRSHFRFLNWTSEKFDM